MLILVAFIIIYTYLFSRLYIFIIYLGLGMASACLNKCNMGSGEEDSEGFFL